MALSDGDLLRFGNTVLSFNKPVEEKIVPTPPTPAPLPPKRKSWWIAVAACLVVLVVVAAFWPKEEDPIVVVPPVEETVEKGAATQPKVSSSTSATGGQEERRPVVIDKPSIKYGKLDDYELQQMAKKDVKAQLELGKRLVNRKDSVYIVLGTNYLKLASRNGSEEARNALQSVKATLRDAANRGNTHAENLLKVINAEQ